MKQFNTPGVKETRVMLNVKLTKSRKALGRAKLEGIKAKLEQGRLNAKRKATDKADTA